MSKLDEIIEQNWKADGTFDESLKPQLKDLIKELIDEVFGPEDELTYGDGNVEGELRKKVEAL